MYDRWMIIESLCHQLQRQLIAHAARFLHLCSFVLKPDLDLWLVELQFIGQRLTTVLRQVLAVVKLTLESIQLGGRECRSWPLLVCQVVFLLRLASSRSCTAHALHVSKRPSDNLWNQGRINPFTADPVKVYTLCHTGLTHHILIFDIRALWRSGLSARAPECQKLKMVG